MTGRAGEGRVVVVTGANRGLGLEVALAVRRARPVAEGAASILWAADLPDDGPTGTFTRDGRPLRW